MNFLLSLLLNASAVLITSTLLPGISIRGFKEAVLVALLLGFVNAFLRPLIFILTLPLNILTLGIFSFFIMGFMVYLVSLIVPGFVITKFLWTIPFALVCALINALFSKLAFRRA